MKVLVTGSGGYVGSVVARQLLRDGHAVVGFDILKYGGDAVLGLYPEQHFTFIKGDVRSRAALEPALAGVDAVVHLAALVGDPACAQDKGLARELNLTASLQLFELARARGVTRFVFASTCSNYGKMQTADFLTEDSELRPVSLYAETKVAVEKHLLASDQKVETVVLRFATVFGLSPRMRFDLTVNEFTMEALTTRKLMVYGAQFWRPYVHVRDAARAIGLAVAAPSAKAAGKVFNVGDTEQNFTKRQLVEMVVAEVGDDVAVDYVHRDEDPRDYRVSFARASRELGFTITRTVRDGIHEVAEALRHGVITDLDDPRYRE
jgi:nucleoside-diphosphate-sugar epimerase